MLFRLGLIATALISMTLAFASDAEAGPRWKFRYYAYDPEYDFYYGPEYIPQPRHYRYVRPRQQDLYEDDEDDYAYEPDFYEPEYVPPRKQRKTYAKPRIEQKPQAKQKSKSQAAKKKPAASSSTASAISCAKAGEIVSGYGFKSVEQVNCKGQVYAFNATRDGKPFSVKLSSASGELTEVKKLK